MAKQVPWDEQTEALIADLEPTISKRYNVSLRSLLLNPNRYMNKKDLGSILQGIRSESGAYFDELLGNLKDEQARLDTELEAATAQCKQIDALITNKSAAARIPYIKPLFISRNTDAEETIIIERYEDSLDAFIGKLINASNYVADISDSYKQYQLGSWIFSGSKNHILTMNPPISPVLMIENGRAIINNILNEIENRAGE